MASLYNSLNWIQDGERGNALVFNRPLKELAQKIDSGEIESASKVSGVTVDASRVDTLTSGDVVYIASDGRFLRALGGSHEPIGVYALINGNHTIITGGVFTTSGLTTGTSYYLSEDTPGDLTINDYLGAIEIGKAISSTELVLSATGGASSGSGSSSVIGVEASSLDVDVSNGDSVTLLEDGIYYRTIGTDPDYGEFIGFYNNETITTSGIYNTSGLNTGSKYYLDTTAGKITDSYIEGSMQIGIAISSTELLIAPDKGTVTTGLINDKTFEMQNGEDTITISYNPDYLYVYVEGILSDENNYTASDGNQIVFNNAFTGGEKVRIVTMAFKALGKDPYEIERIVATAAQDTFTLSGDLYNLDIYKNGLRLDSTEYTINSQDVVLNSAANENDVFVFKKNNRISVNSSIKELFSYIYTATGGENNINIPKYTTNSNELLVVIEGAVQLPGIDWNEVDDETISFTKSLNTDENVLVQRMQGELNEF